MRRARARTASRSASMALGLRRHPVEVEAGPVRRRIGRKPRATLIGSRLNSVCQSSGPSAILGAVGPGFYAPVAPLTAEGKARIAATMGGRDC